MHAHHLRRRGGLAATVTIAAALAFAGPAAADTIELPNGAELEASVTSPADGATFLVDAGDADTDVPVTGTASVGVGTPDVTWIYVVDVSGSTVANACGATTVLACELEAVGNLHADVVASNSAIDAGIVVFGEGGAAGDMSAAGGDQPLVAVGDPDFDAALGSVFSAGISLHTPKSVGQNATDYAAALDAALGPAQASTAGTTNVVFLSDGESNEDDTGFGAALAALVAEDVTIYPFAVGTGVSCGGGAEGTLDDMAAASGTACVPVPDPADLPDIVADLVSTQLLTVEVTVDGAPVTADVVPSVPADGPVTVDWTATAAGLEPGTHEVCVTATGAGPASDPDAVDSVTECITISVFAFDVTPPDATNELGSDNSHTVTATVTGPAGQLAGWPVDFEVSDGPNAGTAGTCDPADCTTDARGEVTFTWTVPIESASLGTDTLTAIVDVNGATTSVDVTKLWEDTTPPVASCPAGPNPGGKTPKAPGKGGQGQNQDGFYELAATDDVWADDDLEVFVTDTGSGTVFGPFAVGDDIKYVEANGATPGIRSGPGQVEWRIKGTGDAQVTAVDGSGNVSDPVDCLVPNPPK